MISKLERVYDTEYIWKIRSMIESIGVSKDLNEQFKKHLTDAAEPLSMDLSIQVRFSSPFYGLGHRLHIRSVREPNCVRLVTWC